MERLWAGRRFAKANRIRRQLRYFSPAIAFAALDLDGQWMLLSNHMQIPSIHPERREIERHPPDCLGILVTILVTCRLNQQMIRRR
ncbi:MAG TPA: hypothetical protein DDY14_14665 [Chromatiaceae bacterium]|jgi:hypothetical protein|nr:MAG: hypothetical protein N838_05325 [Thiohalocapsa sp. PB-PSB1]HBG96524.1 hypothetical protein [Chromatiaceae bacterium]HCS88750.1 hypothetical protein [Chromatiaceae bacterium]